jgi:hypothetical protein
VNITRISNSPEVYSITESRGKRVAAPWTPSHTRSGKCEIVRENVTLHGQRLNPETGDWEKYTYQGEMREPFTSRKERAPRKSHKVTTAHDNGTDYFNRLRTLGATNEQNPDA